MKLGALLFSLLLSLITLITSNPITTPPFISYTPSLSLHNTTSIFRFPDPSSNASPSSTSRNLRVGLAYTPPSTAPTSLNPPLSIATVISRLRAHRARLAATAARTGSFRGFASSHMEPHAHVEFFPGSPRDIPGNIRALTNEEAVWALESVEVSLRGYLSRGQDVMGAVVWLVWLADWKLGGGRVNYQW